MCECIRDVPRSSTCRCAKKGNMEPLSSAAPSQESISSLISMSELAGTTASSTELSANSRLLRGSASSASAMIAHKIVEVNGEVKEHVNAVPELGVRLPRYSSCPCAKKFHNFFVCKLSHSTCQRRAIFNNRRDERPRIRAPDASSAPDSCLVGCDSCRR